MSIRLRLTFWYAATLAATLLLVGAVLLMVFRTTMEAQLDSDLLARVGTLSAALQVDTTDVALQQGADEAFAAGGEVVVLYDAAGAVVQASSPRPPVDRALAAVATGTASPRTLTVAVGTERLRVRAVPVVEAGVRSGTLVVARSLRPIETAQSQLLAVLAGVVPLAVLVAAAVGYLLATRALRPVERLRRAAEDYSAHDLTRRLSPTDAPDDELGRLSRTLDGMLERLAAAVERQRRFTADASHELRTPIATVLADASLALERPRDPSAYRAALGRVEAEAQRMRVLVEGLLTLARADAARTDAAMGRVDLADLIAVSVGRLEGTGARVRSAVARPLVVRGNAAWLERVVDNLLDNAARYAPEGTEVEVAAARVGAQVVMTVTDTGPGIPADERERVFERFHRSPGARGGGAGLGLAIAREAVEAHGGMIAAEEAPGGGARLVVRLPLPRS